MKRLPGLVALAVAALSAAPGWAQEAPEDVALPLGDSQLDQVRGGFTLPGGLQVSIGIERAVYVNDVLVTSTVFTLQGLERQGGARASGDPAALVVQNGAANSVAAGAPPSGSAATVIQNSLDGQHIRSLTIVNATVNSLQLLKGLELQRSIDTAVIDSLRR
jgi:hypothetical protein